MSQQTEMTSNIRKFAELMKKSTLISLFGIVLLIGSIMLGSYDSTLGLILLGACVGLIIMQIQELFFLSRAKNAGSVPLLNQCFNLRLVALIMLGLGISSIFAFFIPILTLIFVSIYLVLTILGHNALIKFAEKHYSYPRIARQGIILFTISTFIIIGASLLSLQRQITFSLEGLMLILLGIILGIIMVIVGQLLVAIGFLKVITTNNSFRSPSPSLKDPTEPTFQSYGASTTISQPANSTYRPPVSSTSSEKKFCRRCGTPLLSDAKFCSHCGSTQ